MRFVYGKQELCTRQRAEDVSVLLTNGLGGYLSTTAAFSAPRCDQGLLAAAVQAPNRRVMLVHRLKEVLRIGQKETFLSTQSFAEEALFWELQLWSGWRWFGNAGTGTALFTALFAGAVLAYVYLAKLRPPRESWFWLAVLLCLGLGYALPYGGGLWLKINLMKYAVTVGSRPLRRAAVHSGILDAERHGPSVEKWKDL